MLVFRGVTGVIALPNGHFMAFKMRLLSIWNPNDRCFVWKGPSFGGFQPQNGGQTGSRYLLTGVIHQLEFFFLVFWRLAGCHHPQTEDGTLTWRNSFFESTPKRWALEQFWTWWIKEKVTMPLFKPTQHSPGPLRNWDPVNGPGELVVKGSPWGVKQETTFFLGPLASQMTRFWMSIFCKSHLDWTVSIYTRYIRKTSWDMAMYGSSAWHPDEALVFGVGAWCKRCLRSDYPSTQVAPTKIEENCLALLLWEVHYTRPISEERPSRL